MKPVHELTPDEAVLELERVCDQLCEFTTPCAPRTFMERRKAELEAWILMHQAPKTTPEPEPEEPMPAPKKHHTEEQKKAAKREMNARWRAKQKAKQQHELIGPHGEEPPGTPVPAPRRTIPLSTRPVQDQVSAIRREVWLLMADLEALSVASREALAPDLALLDAAAHAAHQLALGRLEVA